MAINVFFDLDGTLAEWKEIQLNLSEEEQTDLKVIQAKLRQILLTPGYFKDLAPYQNVVTFANMLESKAELYIEDFIQPDDINILIDDHTPNLMAWEKLASNNIAIKLMNPVNGINGTWKGNVLFYNDSLEKLLQKFSDSFQAAVEERQKDEEYISDNIR